MRTTINLDDDVFQLVSHYSESRALSLGKAVSDLVRKGLKTSRPTRRKNGLLLFDLPKESRRVTSKNVRTLESELE